MGTFVLIALMSFSVLYFFVWFWYDHRPENSYGQCSYSTTCFTVIKRRQSCHLSFSFQLTLTAIASHFQFTSKKALHWWRPWIEQHSRTNFKCRVVLHTFHWLASIQGVIELTIYARLSIPCHWVLSPRNTLCHSQLEVPVLLCVQSEWFLCEHPLSSFPT